MAYKARIWHTNPHLYAVCTVLMGLGLVSDLDESTIKVGVCNEHRTHVFEKICLQGAWGIPREELVRPTSASRLSSNKNDLGARPCDNAFAQSIAPSVAGRLLCCLRDA